MFWRLFKNKVEKEQKPHPRAALSAAWGMLNFEF